jgi:hypothetical protein
LLKRALPRNEIGLELVKRVIVRSNHELLYALERLLGSYSVLLAGTPIGDAEEILWQVNTTLQNAERATVIALSLLGTSREEIHHECY